MEGGMGEMHMGPGGMWWKNPQIATKLGLTADQQKRMEDIFLQSRIQLIHIKATLEEQELLLQPLMDANPPDSAKALAQIGKIADTRAELEKANAKMLLGIRGVLTAAQWTSLHDMEHQRPGGPGRMGPGGGHGGPGGPNAQGGPGRGWGRGGPWGANGQAAPPAKPTTPPATAPPPPAIE
jgi:Spy/CpxP family protein refolding chaperone